MKKFPIAYCLLLRTVLEEGTNKFIRVYTALLPGVIRIYTIDENIGGKPGYKFIKRLRLKYSTGIKDKMSFRNVSPAKPSSVEY